MKYSVQGDGSTVAIRVEQVGSKQADLLREFNECAEGHCSCPTSQYEKVESMQITPGGDQLSITLRAKPGETIEHGDIQKCLEHTTRKVERR
ncbi:MAG TPA: hypothetical protein VGX97_00680 [bacterium]|nr:hypothetical protein [bacterium]